MVIDYHYLNKYMIKNNYLISLIRELINKLKGCNLFTKLDLCSGYTNVYIKEGDEWKTVFIAGEKTYESMVMFFGQTNILATFQNMMNDILSDLDCCVVIYINDIVIFTKPEQGKQEYNQIVREVLDRLRKHDLYLKLKKCFFKRRRLSSSEYGSPRTKLRWIMRKFRQC